MNIYDKYIFKGYLEEGEKMTGVVHKHWIEVMGPMMKVGLFGLVVPGVLIFVLMGVNLNNPLFYLALGWFLIGFGAAVYVFLDWYYDAWVLTEGAVLDVEWEGFWKRSVSRIDYGVIEGVSYELDGFWALVLRFGHLELQKASEQPVVLKNASHPKRAEKWIVEHQERFVKNKSTADAEALKTLLAETMQKHMEEKQAG